ncbi:FAD-dependent monooxygenase [Solwaraspora sp. WMMB335]|uniref:FAD-dependent monooxygenase n=1 Tax=Solwaraspora sp. WMMB335 TaxID=3404118 RepID=UPI003B934A15
MTARATVVGGGLAGALAAVALARAGIGVAVHEAYLDPAGATGGFLTLTGNGLRALQSVGCLDAVLDRGVVTTSLCLWTGEGRLLGSVARTGRSGIAQTNVTIARSDIVAALREEAARAGATIQTGRWLANASSVTGGVAAHFIDGGQVESELLIGADGVHSRVRRAIANSAPLPEFGGHCTIDGTAHLPGIAAGAAHLVFGRSGCFRYTARPDGTVWWSAVLSTGDVTVPELGTVTEHDWRERLLQQYGQGATPAAALIDRTPALGRPVPLYLPYRVARWWRGRMVVIGDAAHPVGYGLGAGLAMEDAVILARCVRDIKDVPTALATYEKLRRPRLDQALRAGARYGRAKRLPGRGWLDLALAPLYRRYFWGDLSSWLLTYDVEWHRPVRTGPDLT